MDETITIIICTYKSTPMSRPLFPPTIFITRIVINLLSHCNYFATSGLLEYILPPAITTTRIIINLLSNRNNLATSRLLEYILEALLLLLVVDAAAAAADICYPAGPRR